MSSSSEVHEKDAQVMMYSEQFLHGYVSRSLFKHLRGSLLTFVMFDWPGGGSTTKSWI